MAKKSGETYRDIIKSICKGKLAPVYLLSGPEPYYLDLITDCLERNVVEDDAKDFDQAIFYGADSNAENVMTSARQIPLLSPRRLVILKEAQSMQNAKNQLARLESYCDKPNPAAVLVIIYKGDSFPTSSKLVKSVAKAGGIIFSSPKIKEYELKGPIRDYLDEKGVGMDDDAMELLISFIGNNLNKLFGEIDKLILSGEGVSNRINRNAIIENIGLNKDFNVFELRKALSTKNYGKAIQIVDYFAANRKDNPVVVITSYLFSFFSNLTLAFFCSDKSEKGLLEELDLNAAWQLREYRDAMQYYNPSQAIRGVSLIRSLDCRSKGIGSTQDEYSLLKETIFEIIRP
ncbi:MAG: DNA polymerase III subunit delta [Bacteroides sp.]|nr:DNA polymerase III subunit delta [Bacteroides sp.]